LNWIIFILDIYVNSIYFLIEFKLNIIIKFNYNKKSIPNNVFSGICYHGDWIARKYLKWARSWSSWSFMAYHEFVEFKDRWQCTLFHVYHDRCAQKIGDVSCCIIALQDLYQISNLSLSKQYEKHMEYKNTESRKNTRNTWSIKIQNHVKILI
jgi:hypothetical protein